MHLETMTGRKKAAGDLEQKNHELAATRERAPQAAKLNCLSEIKSIHCSVGANSDLQGDGLGTKEAKHCRDPGTCSARCSELLLCDLKPTQCGMGTEADWQGNAATSPRGSQLSKSIKLIIVIDLSKRSLKAPPAM